MAPEIKFNIYVDEESNSLRIRIPKTLSFSGKAEFHVFKNKSDATNAQKIYRRLSRSHGKTLKIPSQTKLYGHGSEKKWISYDKLISISKAVEDSEGIDFESQAFKDTYKIVKQRPTSKKVSDLLPIIPTIRKPKQAGHYNPEYLRELTRQANKLIEIFGDTHLSDFKPLNLIDTFLDNEELGYSEKAKYKYKGALSALFKIAVDQCWLNENPVHFAKTRSSDKGNVEIYGIETSLRIIRGASPEMLPSFILGLYAGVRPSEARRINFEDIRINKESAIVTLNANQANKTRNPRTIVLSDAAVRLLQAYQGLTGPVSPVPQTAIPPESDRKDYRDWLDNYYHADLSNKLRKGGAFLKDEIIQNGFRHTYATFTYHKLINEGTTPHDAQTFVESQLGHLDDNSIRHYIAFNPPKGDVMEFWSEMPPEHQVAELEQTDFYQTRIA